MKSVLVAAAVVLALAAAGAQQAPRRTHLVIVVDGLRPGMSVYADWSDVGP